jgi:amino acid transporter
MDDKTIVSGSGGYKQELNRVMGTGKLTIYGIVFMSVIAPGAVFGAVHIISGGLTPLVYLVATICMVFTGLSYKKMSSRFPYAGSVYSYVQRGLNPHVGFLAGWLILIDYILTPAMILGFMALYCNGFVPAIPVPVWVLILLVIITTVNVVGVKVSSAVNIFIFVISVTAFVVFIVFALRYATGAEGAGFSLDSFYNSSFSFSGVATGASIACLSFMGFDAISTFAEEAIEPKKTVGKAVIYSLILAGLFFIITSYAASLAWGDSDLSGLNEETGFFQIAGIISPALETFMLIITIFAGTTTAMVAQAAVGRILYSMGRDKTLPSFLGKIQPKFKTPHVAIILVAVLTIALSFIPVMTLISFINFGALSSFIVLNFTVFWFFFVKEKQNKGAKNILFHLIFPFVGLIILAYIWSGFGLDTYIMGFSWLAVGVVIGAVKSKGYKEVPDALKNMEL